MLRSCLIQLVVLFAAYFFEKQWLDSLGMPHSGWIASGLALLVAFTIGTIEGTIAMHLTDLNRFEDGRLVRASGLLRAAGPTVASPLTGRHVLAYRFEILEHDDAHGAPAFGGFGMSPCELLTSRGPLPLDGMPSLENLPKESLAFDKGTIPKFAALHWKSNNEFTLIQWMRLETTFGMRGGSILFANLKEVDLDTVTRHLVRERWLAKESILPAGTSVTVQATYRSNPPRLEISRSLKTLTHDLYLGDGPAVRRRDLRRQWIGSIIYTLLCVGAHIALHRNSSEIAAWLIRA